VCVSTCDTHARDAVDVVANRFSSAIVSVRCWHSGGTTLCSSHIHTHTHTHTHTHIASRTGDLPARRSALYGRQQCAVHRHVPPHCRRTACYGVGRIAGRVTAASSVPGRVADVVSTDGADAGRRWHDCDRRR
jgi:hypothetical protein